MAEELAPAIVMPRAGGDRVRRCKMTPINRLLMVYLWLKHYSHYDELSSGFGIASSVLSLEIRHILSIICVALRYEIRWPSEDERRELHGSISAKIPSAVMCVDATKQVMRDFKAHSANDYTGAVGEQVRNTQVVSRSITPSTYVETEYNIDALCRRLCYTTARLSLLKAATSVATTTRGYGAEATSVVRCRLCSPMMNTSSPIRATRASTSC
jgi:hypothetical protein